MRCKVNPANHTNLLINFDDNLEPTEDNHDFGADFYYSDNESKVKQIVSVIQTILNTHMKGIV
jgi:hypothetical protein